MGNSLVLGKFWAQFWFFRCYFPRNFRYLIKWNIIKMLHSIQTFPTNYSKLVHLLHNLILWWKISISPVLGNSPSSKNFHFPSTREIPLYWVFPDCYSIIHYTTLHYTTIHYSTIHYSTLQYNTAEYNTVQCLLRVILHWATYLHHSIIYFYTFYLSTLEYITVYYSTIQYNTIQYIYVH